MTERDRALIDTTASTKPLLRLFWDPEAETLEEWLADHRKILHICTEDEPFDPALHKNAFHPSSSVVPGSLKTAADGKRLRRHCPYCNRTWERTPYSAAETKIAKPILPRPAKTKRQEVAAND